MNKYTVIVEDNNGDQFSVEVEANSADEAADIATADGSELVQVEEQTKYVVMCRVSGGVTGTREGPLKDAGQVKYFDTIEAATTEAIAMSNRMNSLNAKARFEYWAKLDK